MLDNYGYFVNKGYKNGAKNGLVAGFIGGLPVSDKLAESIVKLKKQSYVTAIFDLQSIPKR